MPVVYVLALCVGESRVLVHTDGYPRLTNGRSRAMSTGEVYSANVADHAVAPQRVYRVCNRFRAK